MSAKEIVDQSSPAVVRIEADDRVGTGFVIDGNGVIATNLHVIAGKSEITVRTHDGQNYAVKTIAGFDKTRDLALIRIYPKGHLPTVRLGDSNQISTGDKIYAIGNPLGVFDNSVTDGLISQVRPVTNDLTILQISAPISPGSSGGPLFNQFGEVIGITTAIITQGQSINLAVPTNYLRALMMQQSAMPPLEFAKATMEEEPEEQQKAVERKIPEHPVAIWDGCTRQDIEDVVHAISDAIEDGAPAYNRQSEGPLDQQTGHANKDYDPHGYETCFRIYEGTALRFEHSAACKGVRDAFGDGLLRAQSLSNYNDKAWAMRDTFDGLILVAQKWVQSQGNGPSEKKKHETTQKPNASDTPPK